MRIAAPAHPSLRCYPSVVLLASLLLGLAACAPTTPQATPVVVFRNWDGDISPEILQAFEDETGIQVTFIPYETQEEAVDAIRKGERYDVVVLENQLIPGLVKDGLLAEIDYQHVPNFKNISANFRDLTYDPRNLHAIPYSWGTTGIAVRSDLTAGPISSWNDFWDPAYSGKVIAWPMPRYMIGMALKALGYSLNSEDPGELQAAEAHLQQLKGKITLLEWAPAVSAPYLVSGQAVLAMGQADDLIEGQKENANIQYIFPKEGGILWGDNFTIPANAANKPAAERLINFLLGAEVSAQIVNETFYMLPNDAAMPFVLPEIRSNPAIFPAMTELQNAEIMLPLSAEGEVLYAEIWERFNQP